jgi:hypothetical protein
MNLSDLFGTGASITSGTLSISLSSLATAHGFDGSLSSITPAQAFALIIQQATVGTAGKSVDPTYGAVVEKSFDSIIERGTESHIGYAYTCTLFAVNTASTLDPDNVV